MISLDRAARKASTAVLALMLVSGAAGIGSAWVQGNALRNQHEAASLLRTHVEADMMHDAVRSDVLAVLASADPATGIKREEAVADLDEHLKNFAELIAAEKAYQGSAKITELTDSLAKPLGDYGNAARRIVKLSEQDHRRALAGLADFFTQFKALETSMEAASEGIDAHVNEVGEQSRWVGTLAMILLTLALVLGVGMAVYLTRLARQHLVTPLTGLTAAMRRLGEGETDVVVPPAGQVAELGDLTAAITGFRQQLADAEAAREAQTRLIVDSVGTGLGALSQGDLTAEVTAALAHPDVRKQFVNGGAELGGISPEELGAYLKSEIAKWAKAVKVAGVQPE